MCLNLASNSVYLSLFGVVLDVSVGVKRAVLHDDSQIAGHGRPAGVEGIWDSRVGLEGGSLSEMSVMCVSTTGLGFCSVLAEAFPFLFSSLPSLFSYAILNHRIWVGWLTQCGIWLEGGTYKCETRGAWCVGWRYI